MFECQLEQGELFRKIVAAISDLVQEGNFQIDGNHISFQGMDSSHVSLVALSLKKEGFKEYRCDRELTLGINFASLSKVLKCMGTTDKLALKCQDDGDSIFLLFENNNRVSNFELKLMDIDADQLGIPETEYACNVKIPSANFQKIIRDLSAIGDSVTIAVSKEGIKFSVSGDIGNGEIQLSGTVKKNKKKKKDNDDNDDGDEKVKKEDEKETPGNNNDNDEDEDDDMKDKTDDNNEKEKETKGGDGDDTKEDEADDEEYTINAVDGDDDVDDEVYIVMNEPVTQTFALRYLANFTKATGLSKKVILSMGEDVPLMCSYKIDDLGDIAYYLAPKIDDE